MSELYVLGTRCEEFFDIQISQLSSLLYQLRQSELQQKPPPLTAYHPRKLMFSYMPLIHCGDMPESKSLTSKSANGRGKLRRRLTAVSASIVFVVPALMDLLMLLSTGHGIFLNIKMTSLEQVYLLYVVFTWANKLTVIRYYMIAFPICGFASVLVGFRNRCPSCECERCILLLSLSIPRHGKIMFIALTFFEIEIMSDFPISSFAILNIVRRHRQTLFGRSWSCLAAVSYNHHLYWSLCLSVCSSHFYVLHGSLPGVYCYKSRKCISTF
jgi:hypothetical protein